MKLSSMCWCGRSQVEVPVAWVSSGSTASCDLVGCGPGCAYVTPAEQPDEYDEPLVTEADQRTWKMSKFNPAEYKPSDDSTPGLLARPDAVSLLVGDGLCACGCGESPAGTKTKFCMGHDARLKGVLTRTLAAKVQIALYENTTGVAEVVEPTAYAARFSSTKTDWVALVTDGAAKIAARRGVADKRDAERAVLERATRDGAVRVGRWDATDSVAAIYVEDGRYVVEYVDSVGRVQQQKVDVA